MPIEFLDPDKGKNKNKGKFGAPDTPEEALEQLRELLSSAKDQNGNRLVDDETIREIARTQKAMGRLLDQMREIIQLRESGDIEAATEKLFPFTALLKETYSTLSPMGVISIMASGIGAMAELEWKEQHGD